jgi:hypothetical protein
MLVVAPAEEAVRKLGIGWMSVVRPSRQLLRSFLRMRGFLGAIKRLPHPEERAGAAGTRLEGRTIGDAANFLTASEAGAHPPTARALEQWVPAFASIQDKDHAIFRSRLQRGIPIASAVVERTIQAVLCAGTLFAS